ncbi:VapE domain-containing protein [Bordetella petrii]|uniref:phage NrS-1 polymerase family protein n=1 Tax=Bordetella petrii TaxID=94624 RepID=UPI001A9764D7|nr:VapE domain-containing protein [Bordetella petrii]MBO1110677.1 hypothetical protein [Bordetella petrii]
MQHLPIALAGLAAYPQFILWTTRPGPDEKFTKLPTNIHGKPVNAHDPQHWVSFDEAARVLPLHGPTYGIGFVLSDKDPYVFIDVDHALQPDGSWSALAQTMCQAFNGCAVEVSQSGTGLHIIGRGTLRADHACKNVSLGLECYTTERFIALTGTNAVGNVDTLIAPETATWLTDWYFKPRARHNDPDWRTTPVDDWRGPTDDDDLIRRACNSKSAGAVFGGRATFNDLWSANDEVLSKTYPAQNSWDSYDRSSVDMALASHLAFWTGRNHERIEALMRRSALVREKWDRTDYLPGTIAEACAMNRDVCRDKDMSRQPVQGFTANGSAIVLDADSGEEISTLVPLPYTTLAGRPKNVAENVQAVLERVGAKVRYNVITRDVDIDLPVPSIRGNEAKRAWILSVAGHFGLSREGIDAHLTLIADANRFNPIDEWIRGNAWDGTDRLPSFYDTLIPTDDEPVLPDGRRLRHVLMMRWIVAAAAAGTSPSNQGFVMPGVLTLLGPQACGKTRWIRSLVDESMQPYVLSEFKPENIENKDTVLTIVRHFVVELAEVDGIVRNSDSSAMKAFLTRSVDEIRRPYAREVERYERRTACVSTVNRPEFLKDTTGNRRWWVISITRAIADHGIDVQQLWAQALHMYEVDGVHPWLSSDELEALNGSNLAHEIIDPIEERIFTDLDWQADRSRWAWRTVTAILQDVGIPNPSPSETRRAGAILGRFDVERRKGHAGTRFRLVPPKRNVFGNSAVAPHADHTPPAGKP